jgi:hypothetical protein
MAGYQLPWLPARIPSALVHVQQWGAEYRPKGPEKSASQQVHEQTGGPDYCIVFPYVVLVLVCYSLQMFSSKVAKNRNLF